jgi:serine/threonine protein kinase
MDYKQPKRFGFLPSTGVQGRAFARKTVRVTNQGRETIRNEVRNLNKIKDLGSDRNIVSILQHDWLKGTGNTYFVDMELGLFTLQNYIDYLFRNRDLSFEGLSNSDRQFFSRENRMPSQRGATRLFSIVMQISRGLESLHRHGLVHRDMKPANSSIQIPLNIDNRVVLACRYHQICLWKLTDFGITSEARTKAVTTVMSRGTEGYRAPEMLSYEHAQYGNRVDVWALGCIFHELCTGSRLFPYDYATIRYSLGSLQPTLSDPFVNTALEGHTAEIIKDLVQIDAGRRPRAADCFKLFRWYRRYTDGPGAISGRFCSYAEWKVLIAESGPSESEVEFALATWHDSGRVGELASITSALLRHIVEREFLDKTFEFFPALSDDDYLVLPPLPRWPIPLPQSPFWAKFVWELDRKGMSKEADLVVERLGALNRNVIIPRSEVPFASANPDSLINRIGTDEDTNTNFPDEVAPFESDTLD